MYEPRALQKPAERQVVALRKWIANYGAVSNSSKFFIQLAKAFERQIDSDCYRSASWGPGHFEFITDSEHKIEVKMTPGRFNPKVIQRKARFWVQAKGTDVIYRNWQIFGDALRELDFGLVGFKNIPSGFIAGFGTEINGEQVTFTISATPTERYELNRDYSPVRAAERMAPF